MCATVCEFHLVQYKRAQSPYDTVLISAGRKALIQLEILPNIYERLQRVLDDMWES